MTSIRFSGNVAGYSGSLVGLSVRPDTDSETHYAKKMLDISRPLEVLEDYPQAPGVNLIRGVILRDAKGKITPGRLRPMGWIW